MVLFSALVPPVGVAGQVRAALAGAGLPADPGDRLRWSAPEGWHVTLGFYGEATPETERQRARWLAGRLAGAGPVAVSLVGAGEFPGVLWLGVHGAGLTALAELAGSGLAEREYRPHLTLARWPGAHQPGAARARQWQAALGSFRAGPWTATEVRLLVSTPGAGEPGYRLVRTISLGGGRNR